MSEIEIIPFAPELAGDFDRINRSWIEAWFHVEPADEETLRDPERIIRHGGMILFARRGGRVVGTAALIRLEPDVFEIAKMGVEAEARGAGVGDALMAAIIREAHCRGARRLKIETNSRLGAALRLYQRHGFQTLPGVASAHGYARADVFLERVLTPQG